MNGYLIEFCIKKSINKKSSKFLILEITPLTFNFIHNYSVASKIYKIMNFKIKNPNKLKFLSK